MLGLRVKMLSCPALKAFAVSSTKRSQYRDQSSREPKKGRSKALDLASAQLDRLLDSSAPDEEGQRRKRRLLKGPKEFRAMRDAVHLRSRS
jgi:hypothetical protein